MDTYLNLPSLNKFYNHKFVKSKEWNDLVLFHYSAECVYKKIWDDVTLNSRGIIFNTKTEELIARPWKKFFNLSEIENIKISDLESKQYYTLEKWDGSLGILFKYNEDFYISTKGSFVSEQAKWATEWIRKNLNLQNIDNNFTYLFEIIYPENRIVVDYGKMESLILIGMINKKTGIEENPNNLEHHGNVLNTQYTKSLNFKSLTSLSEYCKTLPSNSEGFVITFEGGFKVKIKGNEYLKIHKIISKLSPLSFWEAWDINERKIPALFLYNIPEEFRNFSDNMSNIINKIHQDFYDELSKEYQSIFSLKEKWDIKDFAIECEKNHKKNMSMLINIFKQQDKKLWSSIHKLIRPDSNIIPEKYQNFDNNIFKRIEKIINDL